MTALLDPPARLGRSATEGSVPARPRPKPARIEVREGLPVSASRPARIHPANAPVTAPPDGELFWYAGNQQRWIAVVTFVAFALAGISLFEFSMRSVVLYPFVLVLGLNLVGAVLALASGVNDRRVTRQSHLALVRSWRPDAAPSVDVLLPTCGEDLVVLENTYRHVSDLRWDGELRFLVLDDADRADVAALAARYGMDYVVRPNRGEMKKAGNLVHALGISDGELVAIFDADFCPRPDYLFHLVPYFEDPDTGIVQSPQVFDTTLEMGWLQRCAGATQELFYRWVQPSRDAADAAICVGTNALYRRCALDLIGGFPLIQHSEDVHTGLALMQQGYMTRYVPVSLAKGLCPDDLGAFLNQQYRWANGSLTKMEYTGEGHEPMTPKQKICFWAGVMYYLTTAVNVFAIYLPSLIMSVFYPHDVHPSEYVPFLAGLWVYLVLMPVVSKTRWRVEVLRVQMAYSFSHAVAIFDKVRGREATWVPTGAVRGGNELTRRIGRTGIITLSAITTASWIGLTWDVARFGLADFWPMTLLLIGYSYLSVPLIAEFARTLRKERHSRRQARPQATAETHEVAATVADPAAAPVAVITRPRPTCVHVIVDATHRNGATR